MIKNFHMRRSTNLSAVTISVSLLLSMSGQASAQRPEPEAFGLFEGDTMYTVLPPGAIPAILKPEFLIGEKAAAQMSPNEPVIGIVIDGGARAYSMWHLDVHEIVNDRISGRAIAVTW